MDIYGQIGLDSLESEFPTLHELIVLHGLTCIDLLIINNAPQIARKVGRSTLEVGKYLEKLQALVHCSETNIKEINDTWVPTGLRLLDEQLGGGIPLGEVTEVVGGSGSGKSQFLLRLALTIQPSIIITTEAPLETRRMNDMLLEVENKKSFLDNVSYIYCADLEVQDHILFTQLPIQLALGKYRCVILDSISHHLRRDDAITSSAYLMRHLHTQQEKLNSNGLRHFEREHELMRNLFFKSDPKYTDRQSKQLYIHSLYSHILKLARQYNVAVITANQVSDYTTPFTDDITDCVLDLDCQIGSYSGWDNSTSYRNCHPESNIDVNLYRSSNLHQILVDSLSENQDGPPSKMQKLGGISPHRNSGQKIDEKEQMELLDELHAYTSMETKMQVPALGYSWSRFIKTRVLLMKTYRPKYKKAEEILPVDESTQQASAITSSKHISSIIGGWEVERYYRVISSIFDTCNSNNSAKIPFTIEKAGITELNFA